ncbi:helix-turn-helix domain-containing protein [Brevibacillus humidisoli]|uniref:helix-turn-helix domain-containing protein n=1 Tax=Brevibacillus humidisoli TaxID=2895522 RepID=UPI001E419030|nr:helix-turn-helix domain-containing protein [Brevibacillus humidisoli]UFJ41318.1 helix-turn-helix domain-containing protein [Brevibacillus humidisoli]
MKVYELRTFGRIIKGMRKAKRLSQEELAAQAGVTRQTINHMERGSNTPRLDTIESVAIVLDQTQSVFKEYLKIQNDISVLIEWAERCQDTYSSFSKAIIKKAIRLSLQNNDTNKAVNALFQWITWESARGNKVNRRKINYVTRFFNSLNQDNFISQLAYLYGISFKSNKQFSAFVEIAERIIERVKNEDEKLAVLWYQYANAKYYQGEIWKAYHASRNALERQHLLNDDSVRAKLFSRCGLICLQLKAYQEALVHFHSCLMLTLDQDLKDFCHLNLGRTYYMMGQYDMAREKWTNLLGTLKDDDFRRININNDFACMELRLGNYDKAQECIQEAENLLPIARNKGWHMYNSELLLHRRNKAMLLFETKGDVGLKNVLQIIKELKVTYLQDEYDSTKDYLVDKLEIMYNMIN